MNIPPSLPSLKHLPIYMTIDGLTGYVLGKINQVNPMLMAAIFTIRSLAHTLFYHLANFVLRGRDLDSQKIFLATSTIVNMTFLIALRELNLVGKLFSCLLGLAILGHLIHRVRYIQEQDRRLIQEQAGVIEV